MADAAILLSAGSTKIKLQHPATPTLVPGSGFSGATSQPPDVGAGGETVIANWSVIPRRVFSGTICIAVAAFHMNGIDRVEFSLKGGPWQACRHPICSPWDGFETYTGAVNTAQGGEYMCLVSASSIGSDQRIEIRAIAYPRNNGVPKVLQGGDVDGTQDTQDVSLWLTANAGGTYNGTDYYVAASGGSDSNAGTSSGAAFATVVKACTVATDGDRINLLAGTHTLGQRLSGFNRNKTFITIQPASGVSASSITLRPAPSNAMDLRTDYICFSGLNIDTANEPRLLNTAWYHNCTITGSVPTEHASSSSVAIGTGSKSFTVAAGLTYAVSDPVTVVNNTSNFMEGTVTSYDSGTGALVLNITTTVGSGTYSSWTIQKSGGGLEWCAGDDRLTDCTLTSVWKETALYQPALARNVSITTTRENGALSPKVMIDVDLTDLRDVVDGHADGVQWVGAASNAILYRVRVVNMGSGVPQSFFADQQMTNVAIASCIGTASGVTVDTSAGNQFGKGDPDRNIKHLLILGCTFHSICIYASDAGATSSNMLAQGTAASKFIADVAGIYTVEDCHAYVSSGGYTNATQTGTNTSGDNTMSAAINSNLTPKAALQSRLSRKLVATDAYNNSRDASIGAMNA